MPHRVPDEVKDFLLKYIDSVAEWEALLLLRMHRDIGWDAEQVTKNLYITKQEAAKLLAQLTEKGFLSADSAHHAFRYNAQPELDEKVEFAAELYKRLLIPITHIIHIKAKNRIQAFADAFRLRKDDK